MCVFIALRKTYFVNAVNIFLHDTFLYFIFFSTAINFYQVKNVSRSLRPGSELQDPARSWTLILEIFGAKQKHHSNCLGL